MSSPDLGVTVVGGGIVGLGSALALQRAKPDLPILILDKERRLGAHQSGRNSGVIHSGIYYQPGSQKSELVRLGRTQLLRWCAEHEINFDLCGKVIVATGPKQLDALANLESRGRENGIETVRLSPAELAKREPNVRAVAALGVPSTGVVDFRSVLDSMAKVFVSNGGTINCSSEVDRVEVNEKEVLIGADDSQWRSSWMLNCAGLQSDLVARLAGADTGIRIVGFRGEYHHLNLPSSDLIRSAVYPVPDPRFPFLGIHFTRSVHGDVHVGPNAVMAAGREAYESGSVRELGKLVADPAVRHLMTRHWRSGAAELSRSRSKTLLAHKAREILPDLNTGDLEPSRAGIRAQALSERGELLDDFAFADSPRAVHVLNAPSPAATASFAIGQSISSRLVRRIESGRA